MHALSQAFEIQNSSSYSLEVSSSYSAYDALRTTKRNLDA
jgi:hypothetical protein